LLENKPVSLDACIIADLHHGAVICLI
jgi:hypothetical protein